MPSKSKAQHNLMALVANDPAAAKRLKIPKSVGKEFIKADKGKTFKKATGGVVKKAEGGNMAIWGARKVYPGMRPPGSDARELRQQAIVDKINAPAPTARQTPVSRPAPRSTPSSVSTPTPRDIPKATVAAPKTAARPRPTGETAASKARRMAAYESWVKETRDPQTKSYLETGMKKGGTVKAKLFGGKESNAEEVSEAKAIKAGKITPAEYAKREAKEPKMKKGGKCYANGGKVTPETYNVEKHKTDDYPQFKKGGPVKMQTGGVAPVAPRGTVAPVAPVAARPVAPVAPVVPAAVPVRAPAVAPVVAPGGMKKGGSVTRGDGCATRGKTRGRYI